jgi:hypothetical protein
MAEFLWNSGTFFGDFDTPGQWNPLGPPGAGDTALYSEGGATGFYVVNITTGVTVEANIVDDAAGDPLFFFATGSAMTTGGFDFATSAEMFISSGAKLDVTNALTAANPDTITIAGDGPGSGGTVELANSSIGAAGSNITFTFSNIGSLGGGIIQFDTAGTTTTQTITGVAQGNEFVIGGKNFTGDTVNYSGTTLTVMNGGSTVFTMDNVSAAAGTSFVIADSNIIEAVCYARGTMIRTPTGELPVEKLRPGKQVITLVDGKEVPQTITWLGHRRINLTTHLRPETVAPIRIVRDAVADGVPHRDVVVSPDHAIFVDGMLICARQLVNGTTIRQERDWTAVDYYHVELDQHAILLAEGLPAESYIDTGNSGFFANSGQPMVLHPDLTDDTNYPTREAGSCAPFVWDEASVQPAWQRIADRATVIGQPMPQRATTTDAGLRLRTKRTGPRDIEPVYANSNLVIFILPSRATEVQLLSRAQSPTEARPWLEDRRQLGVRVRRIVLRGADDLLEIALDHPDLTQGWWGVERDGQMMSRWTDGEAMLPLPVMHGTVMLEIHLAEAMTYVVETARAA